MYDDTMEASECLTGVPDHLRLRRFREACPFGDEGSMLMSGASRSVKRR